MLKGVADTDSWYFPFRICPLKEKKVVREQAKHYATHFCIVFEIVFDSLACYIDCETFNTKFLCCYCVECSLSQQILINEIRIQLFTFVWQKNASRKKHAIIETHFSNVSLLTLRTKRDLFTQAVLSLQLSLLRFFLLSVFVCSPASGPSASVFYYFLFVAGL